MFDVFEHFEAGKKIGTGPANYTDVKKITPGTPTDHKNGHISTNLQRQKLSIAVFEPACQGPSHEALDRAVLSIKTPATQKTAPGYPRAGYG